MILVIDNYDSFAHNLARYVELTGFETKVVRNDEISVDEIAKYNPQAIILSPGPCTPKDAGICIETIKQYGPTTPILGVCLGHQCIGEAFGAKTVRSEPMHGKATTIHHDGTALFENLPSPMNVGRYHSLRTDKEETSPLITTATSCDGMMMAMKHKDYPIYGVQFHPESVLTPHGLSLMKNFSAIALEWHQKKEEAA